MEPIDHDQIDDSFLKALGLLVMEWTRIEEIIKESVGKLLSLKQEETWVVSAHIPIKQLLDIFVSTMRLYEADDELEKEMTTIIDKIYEDIRLERNRYVHSVYGRASFRFTVSVNDGEPIPSAEFVQIKRTARGRLKTSDNDLTPFRVNRLIRRIRSAGDKYIDVSDRVIRHVASRRTGR